jgi:DNA-binding SARP family transcriptional activator
MIDLRFSLLGPVRAWFAGDEVNVGSPQQRALLALLLLHLDEPITSEYAREALWDDPAPAAADGTIRTYIYRLRHLLTDVVGADRMAIRTISGGYQLSLSGAKVDAHEFHQHLADARGAMTARDPEAALREYYQCLALWRGVPIAGTYTTYFDLERDRLEQLRSDAVEECVTVAIGLGDHAKVVPILRKELNAQPLREKLWELLILALSKLDRRADALATYRDARQVLRTELGLEPTPNLQELHRHILVSTPFQPTALERFRPSIPLPRVHTLRHPVGGV